MEIKIVYISNILQAFLVTYTYKTLKRCNGERHSPSSSMQMRSSTIYYFTYAAMHDMHNICHFLKYLCVCAVSVLMPLTCGGCGAGIVGTDDG